jgi:hypothetical protein
VAKRIAVAIVGVLFALIAFTGCASDAHRVSDNLSTESEQFRVYRDIVFVNGITDKYLAEVKGYCSVDTQDGLPGNTLAVTCQTGPGQYKKDYLGISDNVTWFMLQSDPATVSPYHYEIVLKPQNIIPSFTGSDAAQ